MPAAHSRAAWMRCQTVPTLAQRYRASHLSRRATQRLLTAAHCSHAISRLHSQFRDRLVTQCCPRAENKIQGFSVEIDLHRSDLFSLAKNFIHCQRAKIADHTQNVGNNGFATLRQRITYGIRVSHYRMRGI